METEFTKIKIEINTMENPACLIMISPLCRANTGPGAVFYKKMIMEPVSDRVGIQKAYPPPQNRDME